MKPALQPRWAESPAQQGAGCTLHDAAKRLGCSLNTLRRKIKSGEIRAERVTRPQGHTWQVYLSLNSDGTMEHGAGTRLESTVQTASCSDSMVLPRRIESSRGPSVSAEGSPPGALVDLVRDLTDRLHQREVEHVAALVRTAETAAMWQARAELLAGELADTRQRLLALQAPQPEPLVQEPSEDAAPRQEAPSGSWWRRWFLL